MSYSKLEHDKAWQEKENRLKQLEREVANIDAKLNQTKEEFNLTDEHTKQYHDYQYMIPSWDNKKTILIRQLAEQLTLMQQDCINNTQHPDDTIRLDPDNAKRLEEISQKLDDITSKHKERIKLTFDEQLKKDLDDNLKKIKAEAQQLKQADQSVNQSHTKTIDEGVSLIQRHLQGPLRPVSPEEALHFDRKLNKEAGSVQPGSKISALYHQFMDVWINFKMLIRTIKPEEALQEKIDHRNLSLSKISRMQEPSQQLLSTKNHLIKEIVTLTTPTASKHNSSEEQVKTPPQRF
jgi:hypothetical protein